MGLFSSASAQQLEQETNWGRQDFTQLALMDTESAISVQLFLWAQPGLRIELPSPNTVPP